MSGSTQQQDPEPQVETQTTEQQTTQEPEPQTTQQPEPQTTEQQTTQAPTPEPTQADWRDKRIATLTRRLRELQENQGRQQAPQAPQQPTQEQLTNQQIEQRARELSAVQDFNRRCDETALVGRSSFGENEFNGRIQNLQKLVDNSDPVSVQAYNSLLLAAIDTGEGAKVLHALGADLNEAQRILALPPTRMAAELTRRSLNHETQVSSAPKPITAVGSRGATHERISPDDADRSDHLSTAEWMRRREAQVKERQTR